MKITAQMLTADAFRSFGYVARAGDGVVKSIRNDAVTLSRSDTRFDHDLAATELTLDFYEVPSEARPLHAKMAERHVLSAQTFVPMSVARWLIVVWPEGLTGAPRAFVAQAGDVVTYLPGLWHHGIVALDTSATFASTMWRSNTPEDTEFCAIEREDLQISWHDP